MAEVYLTFDDGPYPATDEVLDALKQCNVTATFFLNLDRDVSPKRRIAQFARIQRMLKEGHTIANHGVDHDPEKVAEYAAAKTEDVKADFEVNDAVLKKMFLTAKVDYPGMPVARLPGDGRYQSNYVTMIVNEVGVPHAGWDVEFSRNGVFKHLGFLNWQGIHNVAASQKGLPKHQDVLLLHDLHWAGQSGLLVCLIEKLQESFSVRSLLPLPPNLGCVNYGK